MTRELWRGTQRWGPLELMRVQSSQPADGQHLSLTDQDRLNNELERLPIGRPVEATVHFGKKLQGKQSAMLYMRSPSIHIHGEFLFDQTGSSVFKSSISIVLGKIPVPPRCAMEESD